MRVATVDLTNDRGSWTGTTTGLRVERYEGDGVGGAQGSSTVILTGEGAYEGLTAYVIVEQDIGARDLLGVIFAGDMPSPPDSLAAD